MVNNGLNQTWETLMIADNNVEGFFMGIVFRIKALLNLIKFNLQRLWDRITIFFLKIVSTSLSGFIRVVKVAKKAQLVLKQITHIRVRRKKKSTFEERIIEETEVD